MRRYEYGSREDAFAQVGPRDLPGCLRVADDVEEVVDDLESQAEALAVTHKRGAVFRRRARRRRPELAGRFEQGGRLETDRCQVVVEGAHGIADHAGLDDLPLTDLGDGA